MSLCLLKQLENKYAIEPGSLLSEGLSFSAGLLLLEFNCGHNFLTILLGGLFFRKFTAGV